MRQEDTWPAAPAEVPDTSATIPAPPPSWPYPPLPISPFGADDTFDEFKADFTNFTLDSEELDEV